MSLPSLRCNQEPSISQCVTFTIPSNPSAKHFSSWEQIKVFIPSLGKKLITAVSIQPHSWIHFTVHKNIKSIKSSSQRENTVYTPCLLLQYITCSLEYSHFLLSQKRKKQISEFAAKHFSAFSAKFSIQSIDKYIFLDGEIEIGLKEFVKNIWSYLLR